MDNDTTISLLVNPEAFKHPYFSIEQRVFQVHLAHRNNRLTNKEIGELTNTTAAQVKAAHQSLREKKLLHASKAEEGDKRSTILTVVEQSFVAPESIVVPSVPKVAKHTKELMDALVELLQTIPSSFKEHGLYHLIDADIINHMDFWYNEFAPALDNVSSSNTMSMDIEVRAVVCATEALWSFASNAKSASTRNLKYLKLVKEVVVTTDKEIDRVNSNTAAFGSVLRKRIEAGLYTVKEGN